MDRISVTKYYTAFKHRFMHPLCMHITYMRPVDLKILLQIVITVPAIQKSIGAALDDDFKGSLW